MRGRYQYQTWMRDKTHHYMDHLSIYLWQCVVWHRGRSSALPGGQNSASCSSVVVGLGRVVCGKQSAVNSVRLNSLTHDMFLMWLSLPSCLATLASFISTVVYYSLSIIPVVSCYLISFAELTLVIIPSFLWLYWGLLTLASLICIYYFSILIASSWSFVSFTNLTFTVMWIDVNFITSHLKIFR